MVAKCCWSIAVRESTTGVGAMITIRVALEFFCDPKDGGCRRIEPTTGAALTTGR